MFQKLTSALAALALTASAVAQCPIPDNLDGGPCCAPTQTALPNFPAFKQKSLDICWQDCDVDNIGTVRVRWSAPTGGSGSCDPMTSKVRVLGPGGGLLWRGRMRLNYSRTWFEIGGANQTFQVWRFLATGDLRPTAAAGGPPCPVPSCTTAFNRAKYTGYVDWALDCNTGAWSNAWMLTHACDRIDHDPSHPRGGVFHPDRSFTFVGPAASFSVSPVVPGEGGGGPFDAVRRVRTSPVPGSIGVPVCEFEEQIQHQLSPINQYCLCTSSGMPQWQESDLFVSGACGTTIFGAAGTPGSTLPPFSSMGIGRWSDPLTYPGPEALRYNVGDYMTAESCTGITQHEYAFGVTTIGGFPAMTIDSTGVGTTLPPIFIDQANAMDRYNKPLLNIPAHATRILNLNH